MEAEGIITGKTAEGFTVQAGERTLTGKKLLVATGSQAAVPPIPGLAEGLASGLVLTNREALDLPEKPGKLVVIGGGVIGLEMASYFCSVGSEVAVVEMLDHIAGENDAELVGILQKNYEKKGITFHLGARVTKVSGEGVTFEQNGAAQTLPADKVLLSIGRRPTTQGIGLESIGVYCERGAVVTDNHLRTNVPDVYACGDVNGKSMLAHTAYREGEVAVNHMLGIPDDMRYNAIPAVLYTNPELAAVGETEATAKAKGYAVDVVKLPMRFSGRYLAENEGGDGVFKLVVQQGTGLILGVQALSNYASEFIIAAAGYIEKKFTVADLRDIVFPHPTVCEIIREAAFMWK